MVFGRIPCMVSWQVGTVFSCQIAKREKLWRPAVRPHFFTFSIHSFVAFVPSCAFLNRPLSHSSKPLKNSSPPGPIPSSPTFPA